MSGDDNPFEVFDNPQWLLSNKIVTQIPDKEDVEKVKVIKYKRNKVGDVVLPWSKVDYASVTVVDAYASMEYGLHVREAMQIFTPIDAINSVCAPCDGLGVMAEVGAALGIDVVSGDGSDSMCIEAKRRGHNVKCESYQDTIERGGACDVIVLLYSVTSCPDSVTYALNTGKPLIVVTPEVAFKGRGDLFRYSDTSNIYYKGLTLPDGLSYSKQKKDTCNYLDYFDESYRYHVDTPMAYESMMMFMKQGFDVKIDVIDEKFAEGFNNVTIGDRNSVYMYYDRVELGYSYYVDMKTGVCVENPFVELKDSMRVPVGTLLVVVGNVKDVNSLRNPSGNIIFRAQNRDYDVHYKGCRTITVTVGPPS
jgi:hypothetical protein